MAERLQVERLGASGDGVASGPAGPVFVAGALPGEIVLAAPDGRDRARLLAVEEPSADRIEPFCPYYARCGGCVAQHVGPDLYRRWKRDKVATALERAGVDAPVDDLVDAGGAGRRRVTFHVRYSSGRAEAGFMEPRSHDLVAIERCPVAVPALAAGSGIARRIGGLFARRGKPLDVAVTATTGGLDVDLRGSGPPGDALRQDLVRLAGELDLPRLSVHGDTIVERRPPAIAMGHATVRPPPGGFLQATEAGEEALAEAVLRACDGSRRVADLFAGSGPFTLRLARGADVHAVEADEAALRALDRAARGTAGLRQVTTETRDLFRRPLLPLELERFEAVVLDPPRAGAEAQVRGLAASVVPVVAMVSCDPGTFARDAAILLAGGYRVERVLPVDQFKWAAHVEIVGVFRKPKAPRRPRR